MTTPDTSSPDTYGQPTTAAHPCNDDHAIIADTTYQPLRVVRTDQHIEVHAHITDREGAGWTTIDSACPGTDEIELMVNSLQAQIDEIMRLNWEACQQMADLQQV